MSPTHTPLKTENAGIYFISETCNILQLSPKLLVVLENMLVLAQHVLHPDSGAWQKKMLVRGKICFCCLPFTGDTECPEGCNAIVNQSSHTFMVQI